MPTATTVLALNLRTLQLGGPGGWVDLSDPDCTLLRALALSPGQRAATAHLLAELGKNHAPAAKHALEVQLVRLRKKLTQAGAPSPSIKAVRGVGYQLCLPLSIQ